MSKFIIRDAEPEDSIALSKCIAEAYHVYEDTVKDLPDVTVGIASAIDEKRVWVAEHQGSIVGGIVLALCDRYLLLENVAVHPDSSGSGIGKALIHVAVLECQNHGVNEIRLSTHKDMTANIQLYEHLGWSIVGSAGRKVTMSRQIESSL